MGWLYSLTTTSDINSPNSACTMELTGSLVNGGMLIVHKVHEGKHQYEVENVVKHKKTCGEKTFARRGDKLIQINGLDLKDLTPEELTELLAEGSLQLKVHNVSKKKKKQPEQALPAEDMLHPVSKESMLLSFHMEMRREGHLEENHVRQDKEERTEENKENGEGGELLIVSMEKTKVSVLTGRGLADGSSYQDVVLVAESSTVSLVSQGSESFKVVTNSKAAVEHVYSHHYLRGLCSQRIIYASPNPEKITIYYYKSNTEDRTFRGLPVVLNFNDSNCFLRCCKNEEKVFLQVETCEKHRLQQIYKSDESTMSFIFYMKTDRSRQYKFESAVHHGWFIQVVDADSVRMGTLNGGAEERLFVFIIRK